MLVVLAATGLAAGALTWGLGWAGRSPKATILCGKCGQRFEVPADEFRSGSKRPTCPRCGGADLEPVMAVCPHCKKPIRHSDVPPSSAEHAQRLCPFCKKPVPPGK